MIKQLKRFFAELSLGMAKANENIFTNSDNMLDLNSGYIYDSQQFENEQIKRYAEANRFSMYKVLEKLENGENFDIDNIEDFSVFKEIESEKLNNIFLDEGDKLKWVVYNNVIETDVDYTTKVVEDKTLLDKYSFDDKFKVKLTYTYIPKIKIDTHINRIVLSENDDKLRLSVYIDDFSDIYGKRDLKVIKNMLMKRLDSLCDRLYLEDFIDIKSINFNTNKDVGVKNLTNITINNLTPKNVEHKKVEGKDSGYYIINYELNNEDIEYEYLPLKYYVDDLGYKNKYLNKERKDGKKEKSD